MDIREAITRQVHRVYCGTDRIPTPEDGCCGCDASIGDVYLTSSCGHCKAPGESYCWACIDKWVTDPYQVVPVPPYTVHAGHGRLGGAA